MPETSAALLKLAANVSLFAGMSRPQLERLLARAERLTLAPHQLFFDEGERGESFHVLLVGSASVDKKLEQRWVPLAKLRPGDTFGEMSLVDEPVRSTRVKALEACVALQFQAQKLRDLHEEMAMVYRNVARILARRLKASNVEVAGARLETLGTLDEDSSSGTPDAPDGLKDDNALSRPSE
jgi:CRP/FNR family transcriptional regulator, cyclic AMP receptor protein